MDRANKKIKSTYATVEAINFFFISYSHIQRLHLHRQTWIRKFTAGIKNLSLGHINFHISLETKTHNKLKFP